MAGGIEWFRWHHGSVTDPKFQLVARKAAARLGDVIAVWAFVLEKASADADRGTIGQLDFESMDFLLNADSGTTTRILDAMSARGLIVGSRIARWEERQPKREREGDSSTQRTRAYRERKASDATERPVTPSDATERQGTPREEKRREEKKKTTTAAEPPGFVRFWDAWPKSHRKESRGKCLEAWRKADAESRADLIVAHVERLKSSPGWQKDGGQFIPAPLVYLRNRRWEGADAANDDDPYGLKGAL